MNKTLHESENAKTSGVGRRKLLLASGACGLAGLTGCKTMPELSSIQETLGIEPPSKFLPKTDVFQRRGRHGFEQSVAIFRAANSGQPILPFQEDYAFSNALINAVKEYDKAQRRMLSKYPKNEKVAMKTSL